MLPKTGRAAFDIGSAGRWPALQHSAEPASGRHYGLVGSRPAAGTTVLRWQWR